MKRIIKKNKIFLKYLFFAGLSFIIDILLFHGFKLALSNKILDVGLLTIVSTYIARALSSLFNFFVNKNSVFKEDERKRTKDTIFKYYSLVVIQATISGIVVGALTKSLGINSTIIKVPVECVIFLVNFLVQRYYIFAKNPIKINIPDNIKMTLFGILGSITLLADLDKREIVKVVAKDNNI